MRILLIQQEFLDVQSMKMSNYAGNIGIVDVLIAGGAQVDVIYVPHFQSMHRKIDWKQYNVCIINELVHSLTTTTANRINESNLKEIRRHGVRLGALIGESLSSYVDPKGELFDFAKNRNKIIQQHLDYFDFFIPHCTQDIKNKKRILLDKPCFWWSPWSNNAFDLDVPLQKKSLLLGFNGSIYQSRYEYLLSEQVNVDQVIVHDEDAAYWHPLLSLIKHDEKITSLSFAEYQKMIVAPVRARRFQAEQALIRALSRYRYLLQLPAYFNGAHTRVIQIIQASAVCLTPAFPWSADQLCFADGVDCVYYNPKVKGDLIAKLKWIDANPSVYERIVLQAKQRNFSMRSAAAAGFGYLSFINFLIN